MTVLLSSAVMYALAAAIVIATQPATAATRTVTAQTVTVPRRLRVYRWAVNHERGHWYCWGGAGPYCYDCSGAVMRAWETVHVWLPHNVYDMLHSGKLRQIRERYAHRGNIVIWGTYHTELVAYAHHGEVRWTFGAQHSGTRVGAHRLWGSPRFYRLK